MRKISEKTILTALVNIKCVGYPGKCLTRLTRSERAFVLDELIRRGYINEKIQALPASQTIVSNNLHLCQY